MKGKPEKGGMVGVVGAGSFGTAISNLLAHNTQVLLFSRQPEIVEQINATHQILGITLSDAVRATADLQEVAERCTLIFPIVPSDHFRSMMRQLGPFLKPYHMLIHGTKGFDLRQDRPDIPVRREHLCTMSEVIRQESVVIRVGCLSGPNLAKEIMEGQPTATVIASHFDEVIEAGKRVLASRQFQVFGTHELLGAELAGALKNTIALGSGILRGMGLGKNIQAVLISRGLMEMIYLGQNLGASPKAFLGTAGIGDLVCTATSSDSRNFTFGRRLGEGESVQNIRDTMPELAEGVRTIRITKQLADSLHIQLPITEMLYRVIYEGYPKDKAIESLIRYPYHIDVSFL